MNLLTKRQAHYKLIMIMKVHLYHQLLCIEYIHTDHNLKGSNLLILITPAVAAIIILMIIMVITCYLVYRRGHFRRRNGNGKLDRILPMHECMYACTGRGEMRPLLSADNSIQVRTPVASR